MIRPTDKKNNKEKKNTQRHRANHLKFQLGTMYTYWYRNIFAYFTTATLYSYTILCLLHTNILTNVYLAKNQLHICTSNSILAKVAMYKQMIMPIIQLAAAADAVDMCDMVN